VNYLTNETSLKTQVVPTKTTYGYHFRKPSKTLVNHFYAEWVLHGAGSLLHKLVLATGGQWAGVALPAGKKVFGQKLQRNSFQFNQ
jgi:hypothetical protein